MAFKKVALMSATSGKAVKKTSSLDRDPGSVPQLGIEPHRTAMKYWFGEIPKQFSSQSQAVTQTGIGCV